MGEFTRPRELGHGQRAQDPDAEVHVGPAQVRYDRRNRRRRSPRSSKADDRLKFDIIVGPSSAERTWASRNSPDVRPTYGSTSTIFTEYHQARRHPHVEKDQRTALFYGLKVDTGNLTRERPATPTWPPSATSGMRTDENMVRTIELSQLPVETLDYFAIRDRQQEDPPRGGLRVPRETSRIRTCACHVGRLLHQADRHLLGRLVACRSKERVVVVFRSDGLSASTAGHMGGKRSSWTTAPARRSSHDGARAELELSRRPERAPGAFGRGHRGFGC